MIKHIFDKLKFNQNKKIGFEILPNEIVIHIMDFMTNKSLEQFSRTSSHYLQLSQYVWKKKYEQIANNFKIVHIGDKDSTKINWYNMYSNVLLVDIIIMAKKTMGNIRRTSSSQEKYENGLQLFEIILSCRDLLFGRKEMENFSDLVKKKLESFMRSKGNTPGSINQINISHIYFPLLFPDIYVLILFGDNFSCQHSGPTTRQRHVLVRQNATTDIGTISDRRYIPIPSVWKIYGLYHLTPSLVFSLFLC
jgi:hypothetical protein